MMEINDYVLNLKLAKLTGLYQILDPDSIKHFGYNVYHIVLMCFCSFLIAITMTSPIGLYFLKNDITALIYYLGFMESFFFALYKMITIVYHSKNVWECIKVTSIKFMSYQNYNSDIFKIWQKRSFRISKIYSIIVCVVMSFWSLSPCLLIKSKITIINNKGTYGNYRLNIFNLFPFLSDETHNSHFYVFYFFEIIYSLLYGYISIISDTLILMICFGLNCQLSTISDTIESLGRNYSKNESNNFNNLQLLKNNYDRFDDLKKIILDHQNVIKKLKDFINIFGNLILTQILMATNTQLVLCYIILANTINGEIKNYIVIVKLFIALPMFGFQLFILCYLFDTMNDKKDSIIFALYSSEWTDMDIKSKRLILYAMKMNNSVDLKIKFTRTKLVNLELFINTMRMCYSMLSMMVNYNKNRKN